MIAEASVEDPRRALVLGAYSHYPIEMLQPFVHSLRATGFQGRFHVVAAGYDTAGLSRLRELADHVRAVDDDYSPRPPRASSALALARRQRGLRRFYPALFEAVARVGSERNSLEKWRNLEFHLEGLQSLRYEHYYRSLVEDAPDADVVMLTDLRDVVFQRDPFADPVTGLEVYLEDSSEQIGSDGFNTRWVRDLYGKRSVDAWRGRPVSCSGVVVGTRPAIMTYLVEMIAGIVWRRRPMGAHDQGVHNGLLQSGRLALAKVVLNEQGRVITLGRVSAPHVREDGVVVNADGTVPAVVHQWDRHPLLLSRIAALSQTVAGT
jgi:hypothetical protein